MTTVNFSAQAIVSGGALLANSPFGVALAANANAAPPAFATLLAGNNTIVAPSVASGFTVTGFAIIPVTPGSTNAKTLKGITGDTGVPFTVFVAAGAVAGSNFVVLSTAPESVQIIWF